MYESKTFSKHSLIAYGTFSAEDIAQINRCRGQHNKLGFAYQLIFIKLFNTTPDVATFEMIEEIATYASMQLCLEKVGMDIYEAKTIIAHQKEIIKYLRLKKFDNSAQSKLASFIFDIALRLEAISLLKLEAIRFLKESKVLSPPTVVLDRLLAAKRREARKKIFHNVHSKLSLQTINKLNELLMAEETFSKLEFLRTAPGRASSDTILNLVRRLEIIQETGVLNVDLSEINTNYQKILTKEIRIYSTGRIKALEVEHRYTALVCFLHQVYQDTTDFLIDAYSKVLNRSYGKAHRETEQAIEEKNKKIRAALKNYEQLKAMVRDKSIPDAELRLRINQKLGKALKSDEELNLISDKYCDTFKTFTNRLNYLRQFSPSFIKVLDVEPELAQKPGVIEAIKLLKVMNETKGYKWPKQLPVSFIPKKLRQQITSNGKVDKRAWECAVLLKIRDDIKNSNVAVKSSKRFGKFQDLFMPTHEWEKRREEFFRKAKLPQSADLVYDYWKNRLNEAYDIYFKCEKKNPYVKVKNGKWVLSRDTNQDLSLEKQIELKKLKEWMGRQMQKITLPNLLIDVDNELHFTELFMFPSQQGKRVIQDICDIIITLMAHGCNIGIYTMPQLVKETSYERLKRITDWQFTDEALRTALTWAVNAISKSPISKILGGGKTSGSDAYLIKFHEKVLSQEFNSNFPGFALAFYTFVADNYAPYRSKPIECNEGEAPHALDGALYNESDLSLEEHYTDTRLCF